MTRCTTLAVVFAVCLLAAGCARREPAPQPVRIAVPAALTQLADKWVSAFDVSEAHAVVSVARMAGSDAVRALIEDRADVVFLSRPLTDAEALHATGKNAELLRLVAAVDGVAVCVSSDSSARHIEREAVWSLFREKALDPRAFGFADGPVRLVALKGDASPADFLAGRVGPAAKRPGAHRYVDTAEELAAAIKQGKRTAALVPFSVASRTGLRMLSVAPPNGKPVAPSQATLRDGSYPLPMPLFMFIRERPVEAVKSFADHVLRPEGQAVAESEGMAALVEQGQPVLAVKK